MFVASLLGHIQLYSTKHSAEKALSIFISKTNFLRGKYDVASFNKYLLKEDFDKAIHHYNKTIDDDYPSMEADIREIDVDLEFNNK